MDIPVKRLTWSSTIPKYGTTGAVGMDFYADLAQITDQAMPSDPRWQKTLLVQPGERVLVPTGIAMAIPEFTYLRIADRSGLALKNGIHMLAGVIDPDYRGEIKVLLINLSDQQFVIKHGDRIAQGVLEKVRQNDTLLLVDELPGTERGAGGFGSTGSR